MRRGSDGALDPRAWLLWAFAAGMAPLLGRNPWPLLVTLAAVIGVRLAWAHRMTGGQSWSLFVRLAMFFALIGIVFNVLTVRAGDRVIGRLPEGLPLVGGTLTLNAAAYGATSGLALVLLVMIGSTTAALLDWTAIVRLLPPGLTTVAVAGSIAFAFVPQTAVAFREIKEAQSARGHRIKGARDLLPIIVPLVGNGLERAVTLSEALESRGFGATSVSRSASPQWIRYSGATSIAMAATAAFAIASGRTAIGGIAALSVIILIFPVIRVSRMSTRERTRYRASRWGQRDTLVAVSAGVAIVVTLLSLQLSPEALRYEPYPRMTLPYVGLPSMAGMLLLLLPAVVAPPHAGIDRTDG